jgi:hypothetical protein
MDRQQAVRLLFLTLFRLRRLTGWLDLLRHSQAKATKLRVVVLSTHGEYYSSEALASGATAFVRKGDIDELVSTLTELLVDC